MKQWRAWVGRVWRTGVLVVLAVALPAAGAVVAGQLPAEWVGGLREREGMLVVPFVLAGGVVLGMALLPSHVLSLLGGYLFGWAGAVWVGLAVGLGTWMHWVVTRRWSGTALRGVLERSATGRVLAGRMLGSGGWSGAVTVALARLAPQVPFALGSVLAASCRITLPQLLVGTWVGMAPRVLLVVWIGRELSGWTPGAPVPAGAWWALGGGVLGLGGLAWWAVWLLRRERAAAVQVCSDLSR